MGPDRDGAGSQEGEPWDPFLDAKKSPSEMEVDPSRWRDPQKGCYLPLSCVMRNVSVADCARMTEAVEPNEKKRMENGAVGIPLG